MLYIRHANLVLEDGILWNGALMIDGDRIAQVGPESEMSIPRDAETVDAGGLYVGPGFVDIHVHGGDGRFLYQEPEEACRHFLRHGETTILPTLYYDLSKQGFLDAIDRIKAAKDANPAGAAAAIGGLYMEGPYMNPRYGACADKNLWRGPIREEDYKELVDRAGSFVRVWAIAPEREGLELFIRYASRVNPGVTFSVGHSEATPSQVRRYKKYGLRMLTHAMDATGQVVDWLGTRGCGPDEACLSDPDMYAEVICDSHGIHVRPELLRMMIRCKTVDRLILITDSFVNDMESPESLRYVEDLVFDDNKNLNGSKLTLDGACRNLMAHTNCGIAQAFLMASRNPARVIGAGDELGTIEQGKRANLVFVDDVFRVNRVMLNGRFVETAEQEGR